MNCLPQLAHVMETCSSGSETMLCPGWSLILGERERGFFGAAFREELALAERRAAFPGLAFLACLAPEPAFFALAFGLLAFLALAPGLLRLFIAADFGK